MRKKNDISVKIVTLLTLVYMHCTTDVKSLYNINDNNFKKCFGFDVITKKLFQ